MVESKKSPNKSSIKTPSEPKSKKAFRVFKVLLAILALLIIVGGIFAICAFFGIIDLQKVAKEHNLQNYPIIGSYFSEPKTNFSPVELDMGNISDMQPNVDNKTPQTSNNILPQQIDPNNPIITDQNGEKLDIKKIEKQRQQEEAKRISKAARYYSNMKPEEAVPILNRLDDDTVVAILSKMEDDQAAKILATFDAGRSARLTQVILRSQPHRSLGI